MAPEFHPLEVSPAAPSQKKGVGIAFNRFRKTAQAAGGGGEIAHGRFEIAAELSARFRKAVEGSQEDFRLVYRTVSRDQSPAELTAPIINLTVRINQQQIRVV